jgi:CheY-like chemotaxis protein
MARVTVVNDNPEFLELVEDILEDERYEATKVDGDRDDALELIRSSRPDLLIIDLRMGREGLHGWDVAQQVRADPASRDLPILVCSADVVALNEVADELSATKDVETLVKPFHIDELTAAIDRLLAQPSRG